MLKKTEQAQSFVSNNYFKRSFANVLDRESFIVLFNDQTINRLQDLLATGNLLFFLFVPALKDFF